MTAAAGTRPRRHGGRVTVVGAINLDVVVVADRLPGPGETVVGPEARRHGGGKGANAALAAARAGARVRFVGAVGRDGAAAIAERELREAGVECDAVARLAGRATGTALIVVDAAGENQIAVGAGANGALDAGWVRRSLETTIADTDCVLVSTEIPDAAVIAAVELTARAGVVCVLNPAPPTDAAARALEHHPLLTPNRGELGALGARLAAAGQSVPERAAQLARVSGAPVLVTLGADGALVVDPAADAAPVRLPAPAVDVVDATGAGDTFNGVLAARLAAGAALAQAAQAALVAASLSTTAAGARAGMPTAAAIAAAGG